MKNYDIIIIGGGASGLAAAIEAARAEPSLKIAILERLPRIGKKILATGNGRCNLSNSRASSSDYNNPSFVKNIFDAFDYRSNISFFKSMGLMTFTDSEGRTYPLSNTANSVLDALRYETQRLNTETICDTAVKEIKKTSYGFIINSEYSCRKLIIAAGGKAAESQGSDGSGFVLATQAGHTITPLFPSLVQIVTEDTVPKQLKGVRCSSKISIIIDSKVTAQSEGEILFTEYGLSGIAAMDVSRSVSEYFCKKPKSRNGCVVSLNLIPSLNKKELERFLIDFASKNENIPLGDFLSGIVPKKLGSVICKASCHYKLDSSVNILRPKDFTNIVDTLKDFRLCATGTKGFSNAQVTAGGVVTSEIALQTLESRIVPGLYFCGEVLDIDARCGGYNLQWAWSSGRLAGKSAAQSLSKGRSESDDKNK